MIKRFLNRLFIFILLTACVAYPIDYLISKTLINTHDNSGDFEVLKDIYNGIDTDLAIYGSSRAMAHFDSKKLESKLNMSVYNFGINGNRFIMQYLRHLKYFEHAKNKPKIIILSLDVFSLKALEEGNGIYNHERLLPYMLWDNDFRTYTKLYSPNTYDILDYYIPLYRYHGNSSIFLKYYTLKKNDIRYKGFVGKDEEWKKETKTKLVAKKVFENYKLDHNAQLIFENFLNEMSNENIPIILIYSPEHISGQKLVKSRHEILKYYKEVAEKQNITFIDYSDAEICKNKKYFYNSSHLNLEGVDKFMDILIKDLENDHIFNTFAY